MMDRLKILKRAKEIYSNNRLDDIGMCYCIERAYDEIEVYGLLTATEIIPEFNRKFLDAPRDRYDRAYWWPVGDTESRIKAFDKLIKYYETDNRN